MPATNNPTSWSIINGNYDGYYGVDNSGNISAQSPATASATNLLLTTWNLVVGGTTTIKTVLATAPDGTLTGELIGEEYDPKLSSYQSDIKQSRCVVNKTTRQNGIESTDGVCVASIPGYCQGRRACHFPELLKWGYERSHQGVYLLWWQRFQVWTKHHMRDKLDVL
jgi:hypothetical protein